MVPAFIVAAIGVNATDALVLSQVVLSLVLPVPMIALIIFTSRRDIMGAYLPGPALRVLTLAGASAVLGLNTILILLSLGVQIPGLGAN